jgi:hypothetical protein
MLQLVAFAQPDGSLQVDWEWELPDDADVCSMGPTEIPPSKSQTGSLRFHARLPTNVWQVSFERVAAGRHRVGIRTRAWTRARRLSSPRPTLTAISGIRTSRPDP